MSMTDKEKRTITEQSAADESMRAADVNGCDGADEPCDAAQEPNDEMKPSGNPEADAQKKLNRLLFCGNDRVELSAAKEILAMAETNWDDDGEIKLDVTIKIV